MRGQYILFFDPFPYGLIHQITLSVIDFIAIFALKYSYKMTKSIQEVSSGLNRSSNQLDTKTLSDIIRDMRGVQKNAWWITAATFCGILFIIKNIHMEFVPKTKTGYFAAGFGGFSFSVALLGYAQIVIFLFFFSKIAHNKGNCIPIFIPDDTIYPPHWLTLWVELFETIKKIFFIVGMLFTFEYLLLMPSDIISIKNKRLSLNTPYPWQVVSGWLVIILFIFVALPFIFGLVRHFMKVLLKNMNYKIMQEHKKTMIDEKNIDLLQYKKLMENNVKYGTYIYEQHDFVPAVTTVISLLLNCLKIYESIADFIPFP